MLTTTLDLRELEFLIRQIDEYIRVMELMIRKTPALDQRELALARKLKTKLSRANRANIGGRTLRPSPARRRVAGIDDEVRLPQEFLQ